MTIFTLTVCYYFVFADRLSGWFEARQIKVGIQGCCKGSLNGFTEIDSKLLVYQENFPVMMDPNLLLTKSTPFLKVGYSKQAIIGLLSLV